MQEAALLLADGRWPGGGYAHSGGLEAAVADGAVHDTATLEAFAAGRTATIGVVEAWLAARAWQAASAGDAAALLTLHHDAEARQPSPTLRAAGRALGRGLRRVAAQIWAVAPADSVEQYPVVLGAVAAAAGLSVDETINVALHHALFGPLNAAPKLMAIDMAEVCAIAIRLAPLTDTLRSEVAAALAAGEELSWSAPLIDIRAEQHATWEVRLFAS